MSNDIETRDKTIIDAIALATSFKIDPEKLETWAKGEKTN